MVTSPNMWNILEWDERLQTNKQTKIRLCFYDCLIEDLQQKKSQFICFCEEIIYVINNIDMFFNIFKSITNHWNTINLVFTILFNLLYYYFALAMTQYVKSFASHALSWSFESRARKTNVVKQFHCREQKQELIPRVLNMTLEIDVSCRSRYWTIMNPCCSMRSKNHYYTIHQS